MLTAITREVSPALERCELTYLPRQPIDVALAVRQHRAYCDLLRELGAKVIVLGADPELPDSVFVEDPAVVVDEVAVIARMGAASRMAESETMAAALEAFRPLRRMSAPATLEGGDVIRADRTLFVGLSQRTNREGVRQLAEAVEPFGYTVHAVEIRDCLHLKSGCCYLGAGTMLANREWVDLAAFEGYRVIDVAEPWAADVLAIGDTVVIPAGFPATQRLLEEAGWRTRAIDVSELQKAEAGVTCMSVLFEA